MLIIFSILNISAARNTIYSTRIKTIKAVVNNDWLSPPVMTLGSDDILNISFDELSHDYHRFIYHIDHCEADWSISNELFESDYLEGFNDRPIEDYQNSINTTKLYTHYKLEIPNENCKLKLSGNYILTVYDETNDNEKMLEIRFMVVEPLMTISLGATTNTDIDINNRHQQISMSLTYNNLSVTNHNEQIYTVITQNNREDNKRVSPEPNIISGNGLRWQHNRKLIFEAGNEYHKYEILALSHPTMGIEKINWDGNSYQVYPFVCEPRPYYIYDEDANGAFYVRNSDNYDNDFTCDYVMVNYKLKMPYLSVGNLFIDGEWTTDSNKNNYIMHYNDAEQAYEATILQKQGYYSYQFLQLMPNGQTQIPITEGSFYQTENKYQAYVYYRPTGARTWQLVGYRQIIFDAN